MIPAPLVLAPSLWERRWLYLSHACAAFACLFSPWLWAITLVVAFSLYRSLYLKPSASSCVMALADGSIRLTYADGKEVDAVLLPSSRVMGGLIVLHLIGDARPIDLVIWPDSAPAESLRQWRVWLLWQWPALQSRQTQD
ncbi:protein YgfX [Iodobacter arcticus]|uniref:Protein YgfX n=1 Tax=Iodobacter arcticus TaxID=590593 RepID=A0ABW2R257_9NEIS